MFTLDPAGNWMSVTVKVAVHVVIAFAASLVMKSSMRTVPCALDSGAPTGGTSLAGRRTEVNTGLGVGVGVGDGVGVFGFFETHPAARVVTARAIRMRFMIQTPCVTERSEELAGQVEAQVQRVGKAAAGQLAERAGGGVGERELKHVATGAPLDTEGVLHVARSVAADAR